MTKGLENLFDLPSMDEILKETEVDTAEEPTVPVPALVSPQSNELISIEELKAQEHGRAMDDIYTQTIQHAKDAAELAFDLDPARAPRMLEVAAIHFKTALEAKNSKRDAQLKLMKLIQDQQKLDLEAEKFRHETGNVDTSKADVIMVEDRNTLLARLKKEAGLDEK